MRRFRRILLYPVGRPEEILDAVRQAADLASRNGAELTLFGTIPEPTRLQRLAHGHAHLERIEEALRHEMESQLEQSRAAVDTAATTKIVEAPNPGVGLVLEVISAGHDLVVVAVGGGQTPHSWMKRLLRKCPCPVWVMRTPTSTSPRVLAAIDLESQENALSNLLLEVAASVSEMYGAELHVAHAWHLYGESELHTSAFMHVPDRELEELREATRERCDHDLRALVSSSVVRDAPWIVHVENGLPGEVIPALVDEHRIDLIVIGTIGRSGIKGAIIGDTAEQILDAVPCSVVALKPPDFVSPLAP